MTRTQPVWLRARTSLSGLLFVFSTRALSLAIRIVLTSVISLGIQRRVEYCTSVTRHLLPSLSFWHSWLGDSIRRASSRVQEAPFTYTTTRDDSDRPAMQTHTRAHQHRHHHHDQMRATLLYPSVILLSKLASTSSSRNRTVPASGLAGGGAETKPDAGSGGGGRFSGPADVVRLPPIIRYPAGVRKYRLDASSFLIDDGTAPRHSSFPAAFSASAVSPSSPRVAVAARSVGGDARVELAELASTHTCNESCHGWPSSLMTSPKRSSPVDLEIVKTSLSKRAHILLSEATTIFVMKSTFG
jgi:hypothetical protein